MKILLLLVISIITVNAASKVQNLGEATWRELLNGEWMVEFYAPWCPSCKNLEPVWNEFGGWANDLSINVAKVDVVTSPGLSGRFFVSALPTIFHVINGEFRQYRGSRDMNSFMSFIEDKKWQSIDPITSWKKPDSIPMSVLSWFFKLSHFLKELNNTLLVDYGLPVWGSYAIFAIATILLGAIVGLVLVCIIDFIWPQKATQRQSFSEVQLTRKLTDENIKGDELDDDEEDEDIETSDAEKNSGSDNSEAGETKDSENAKESPKHSPVPSPDVRKRRTRKAD